MYTQLKKRQLKNCRLYVIIDEKTAAGRSLAGIARKAIAGGVDIIQLRPMPETLAKEISGIAGSIRNIAKKAGCLFIINDRVDIAYATDADGVHLGQGDLPIETARAVLGPDKIVGISTHSVKQAIKAQKEGADYISVGPVFRTPTKAEYAPVGLGLIEKISARIKIPFFAIGGINQDNVNKVIAMGAHRIAVVRAVINASDIEKAAVNLRAKSAERCL